MDVEHPLFDTYESRFNALAEAVETMEGALPALSSVTLYLCLYGDNGLQAEEELALLEKLEQAGPDQLHKLEVSKDYWQDVILFLP